jgi:hypothetical protein
MSKDQIEKQAIEELFDIITTDCDHICDVCEFQDNDWCFTHYVSARIYNAGYRKQSVGEWILVENKGAYGDNHFLCTVCEGRNRFTKFTYCPKCGAKMKGGAE